MLTTIASIIIFSLVILIHELGHFLAARSVGIKVNEFSIGMGPVLLKKKGKNTDYLIKAFPIGGYIKMEGEDNESFSDTSFNSKSAIDRFKVIFMGPFMNFILSLIIFFIIILNFGIAGSKVDFIDENSNEYIAGLRSGDEIMEIGNTKVKYWEDISSEISNNKDSYKITILRNNKEYSFDINQSYKYIVGISPTENNGSYTTVLDTVNTGYPADKAGLKSGDKILSINNIETNEWDQVKDVIIESKGNDLNFKVDRNGNIEEIIVSPQNQLILGFYTEMSKNLGIAVTGAFYKTIYYIKLMFNLIIMMISGKVGSDAIAGPIGIISMVGEAAKLGIYPLLNLAAFISINLGFINLLPIPALDGSRLMFIIIEGISRKRIPPEKEGYIHFVGFVFLMALMFFVLYKDILRLMNWGQSWKKKYFMGMLQLVEIVQ